MPGLTDLIGLLGSAAAIAAVLLGLPGIARLRRAHPGPLLLAALVAALVPIGALPAAGYVRGILGDLSVTTVLLLLRGLLRPVLGWAAIDARSRLALQVLVAVSGLVLYPPALGLGSFDPYRLGYANTWFITGLLALAVAAGLLRLTLVTWCLALAVLAWAVGAYESHNLWDYLVDPLVAAWGLCALLLRGALALRRPEGEADEATGRRQRRERLASAGGADARVGIPQSVFGGAGTGKPRLRMSASILASRSRKAR